MIEGLTSYVDAWLEWAWRANAASLGVLVVLLIALLVLRRSISVHLESWLLLLPLVPLVLPPVFTRSSGPSLPEIARVLGTERWEEEEGEISTNADGPVLFDAAVAESGAGQVPLVARNLIADTAVGVDQQPSVLPLRVGLVLAWWSMSILLLSGSVLGHLRLRKLIARAHPSDSMHLRRRFKACVAATGASGNVTLRISDDLASPVTVGITTPTVLLPKGLSEALDDEAMDWVLLHELAHVRRRDVLVEALIRMILVLWPWHPSVWICGKLARDARELACDEAGLARSNPTYGPKAAKALLLVLERGQAIDTPGACAVPFIRSEKLERKRVMKLLKKQTGSPSGGTSLIGRIALICVGICVVPLSARGSAGPGRAISQKNDGTAVESLAITRKKAIHGSLRYLVKQQEEDGRWSAGNLRAGELNDVGVTGATILALLSAPEGVDVPGVEKAIRGGLKYLRASFAADAGLFQVQQPGHTTVHSHSMALRAWIRGNYVPVRKKPGSAKGMYRDWRIIAGAGIQGLLEAKCPYGGFGYEIPSDGAWDSFTTGVAALALIEAKDVGGLVPEATIMEVLQDLPQVYTASTGHFGYSKRGEPCVRFREKSSAFPGDATELPTAISICATRSAGVSASDRLNQALSASVLLGSLPRWSAEEGTTDAYYWVYGTHAMQGLGEEITKPWNNALQDALLGNISKGPGTTLYWKAVDAWHEPECDVAMTAMCLWALESIQDV